MATIEYLGHSCFLVRGEEDRFLTDPFGDIGYEMPKVKAGFVTISHGHYDHCNTIPVSGVKRVFTEPLPCMDGQVDGVLSYHDDKKGALRGENVIFRFTVDGVTYAHMGDVGEPPRQELLDFLRGTDVLMIPVGGVYTIDAAGAKEYVDRIRPRLVFPMHYRDAECNIGLDPLDRFLALFREEEIERARGRFDVNEALEENDLPRVIALERRV